MGLRETLTEIKADCERDVSAREGKPLTGPNVAVWLGEMQALIAVLADVSLVLLQRIETLETHENKEIQP